MFLKELFDNLSTDEMGKYQGIFRKWDDIVGNDLADHVKIKDIERDRIVVGNRSSRMDAAVSDETAVFFEDHPGPIPRFKDPGLQDVSYRQGPVNRAANGLTPGRCKKYTGEP